MFVDQVKEIQWMQQIPYLLALPAEPHIFKGHAEVVTSHPERKDPLVGSAELPRPCNDATPIDDRIQPVRCRKLLNEILGA